MLDHVTARARTAHRGMWIVIGTGWTGFLWAERCARQVLSAARTFLVGGVAKVLYMALSMLVRRDDFKVLRSIVRSIAVLVMHMFVAAQQTAEHLFQDASMIGRSPTLRRRVPIALVDVPTSPLALRRLCVTMPPYAFVVLIAEAACNPLV